MNHTPTPWAIDWEPCCDHRSCQRQYPANFGTFTYGTGFEPDERAKLDAAFTALNSHDALVRALEEAIQWDCQDDEGVPAVWLKQAQDALALAKGETQ